ncbi:MAG: aromatic amino acid transaminase [Chlamydiales bacterium]
MSFFDEIPLLPDDPILGLPILFAAEPRPNKVNLGIGSYKTAEGLPLVLNSVRKAENLIVQRHLNKEYLPIDGDAEFLKCALQLIFGGELSSIEPERLYASQTIGGSGALRVAGELFSKLISRNIFLPQPSWPNHKPLFERGGMNVGSYPYFDPKTHLLDFKGMCQAINNLPPASIILLHASCHNPTGVDPTAEQWRELSGLIKKRGLFPFFDFAYQGFGDSIEADAQSVRLFASEGHEMMVAYSFSKNFGLYGERVGLLSVLTSQSKAKPKIASQIKTLIRGNYSSPPLQGARIVSTILKSHELTLDWKGELSNMSERIIEMRKALVAALLVKGHDRNFDFILKQNGLFSFIGLTKEQVDRLRSEYAIYMPSNGRINLAGLNTQNIEYFVQALLSV